MVPLGALGNVREIGGPIFVNRYNLYTAASIIGNHPAGNQFGRSDRRRSTRRPNETLPLSMNKEWTELMFMQIRAGNTAMYVFALAVACVFLALAALYESWSLPLAVILVVPLCLLCSVLGVRILNPKTVGEHFRADRPGGAGRAGVQELDPDRRVRQAAARAGPAALRSHAGGVAAAAAAHPDDLLRLHSGRRSAGVSPRGRGRNAPLAGNGRLQRHVGRHRCSASSSRPSSSTSSTDSARRTLFRAVATQWIGASA